MFPLLSLFSLLLSLPCFASLLSPFLLQEILTIAIQNVSPLAGGSKDKLGWDWMLGSTGSSSVTRKQRMLFPTSKVLLRTQQTGGQKSLYSYRWSCLWSWHIQKIVWRQPLLWVRVPYLQFHIHHFKVLLVTVQKADSVPMTSSFEGVTGKDLKSGSRQVMRLTQPDFVAQDQLGSPEAAAVWGPCWS